MITQSILSRWVKHGTSIHSARSWEPLVPKLILGTAQWGSDYGLTNRAGRVPNSEIEAICRLAREYGLQLLDTSPSYGDAELRIASLAYDFRIQTKIVVADRAKVHVFKQVAQSQCRLQRDVLDSVLIHDWSVANSDCRNMGLKALSECRSAGDITAIGVSVYTADDLRALLNQTVPIDVIQVPVNVLDQRLDTCTYVHDLRSRGVCIQARSVLLQGLLAEPEMGGILGSHYAIQRWKASTGGDRSIQLRRALAYVSTRSWIDEILIGVASSQQFRDIWAARAGPIEECDWETFACEDLDLIDPRRWPSMQGSV